MSIHKYQLKNGVGWRAIVQVTPTKQRSKKFRRKIDAEAWERELRSQLQSGDSIGVGASRARLADFSREWIERYAKAYKQVSSVKRDEGLLRLQILPFFGERQLSDIGPKDVETWIHRLRFESRLSPTTCNLALGLLRKILNDAVRWQAIRFNPISSVRFLPKAERDMDYWTTKEASDFLAAAKEHDHEVYLLFATALYSGMRLGELRGLQWDCVDLGKTQITVKRSYCQKEDRLKEHTKSKRIRHIPINASLLEILLNAKANCSGPWVFSQSIGYPHLSRLLERIATSAGIQPIRFHDLRHTFASIFMMSGGLIYDLQKLLGHSTILMTERYSHLAPGHLKGKTDLLDFGTRPLRNVTPIRLSIS